MSIYRITLQFQDVLRAKLLDSVQRTTHGVEHKIDTIDTKPINLLVYRLNPIQFAEQTKQIEDLLWKGLIRPSTSL